MKGKAILSLMVATLLTSMLLIGTVKAAGYTPGAGAKFLIQFDPPYNNASSGNLLRTGPPPNITQTFNVSVYISNVTAMVGYSVSLVWYHNVCQATRNIWDYNVWGAPSRPIPFTYNGPWNYTNIGYFDSLCDGLLVTQYQYNLTTVAPVKLFTIEFVVVSYGFSPFYIVKQNNGQPGAEREALLVGMLGITPSVWVTPTTPIGSSEDYDVVWLVAPPPDPGCYTGAIVIYPLPFAPQVNKTETPTSPKEGEIVTITVTEMAPGFNGSAIIHINSVTIDYGDGSPTNTSAFTPPSIQFLHAYSSPGWYIIKVYCFVANMDPVNMTNPIFVRPIVAVGGKAIPINKLQLLAPYIALASTILAATAIYVKRRKKQQ